jgi:hypothetical protein
MTDLARFQAQVKAAAPEMDAARTALEGLIALRDALTDSAPLVEAAQVVGDQLIALQQSLADQAGTVESAREQADGLIALQDRLNQASIDCSLADRNLSGMIALETRLTAQTGNVANAIQALDVLTGFQEEFATQVQSLGEMRHSLIELSLLETSVTKAVRLLQPLLELGNVRRLSDDELRSAAQRILEGRATRISQQPATTNAPRAVTVPLPQE